MNAALPLRPFLPHPANVIFVFVFPWVLQQWAILNFNVGRAGKFFVLSFPTSFCPDWLLSFLLCRALFDLFSQALFDPGASQFPLSPSFASLSTPAPSSSPEYVPVLVARPALWSFPEMSQRLRRIEACRRTRAGRRSKSMKTAVVPGNTVCGRKAQSA